MGLHRNTNYFYNDYGTWYEPPSWKLRGNSHIFLACLKNFKEKARLVVRWYGRVTLVQVVSWYIVHCTLYIVHCTLYIVHCASCTNLVLFTKSGYECPGNDIKCGDGLQCIDPWQNCNDKVECRDGSDESDETCAGLQNYSSYLFSIKVLIIIMIFKYFAKSSNSRLMK